MLFSLQVAVNYIFTLLKLDWIEESEKNSSSILDFDLSVFFTSVSTMNTINFIH